MSQEFINPSTLSQPSGYTQVVAAMGKKMIFVSGQIGVDAQGKLAEGLRAQTIQIMDNIKAALDAAGASMNDVVKANWYVVDYQPEYRALLREIRAQYFSKTNPPASTLVGVQALAFEGLLIEVEAVAVVD